MRGMMRVILRGAVACVVGAGSGYGQNQNNPAAADSAALPEIVVTATRMETDSEKVPQSVAVATSAEIRERHPTQPVEAVRDEPGVWIQKTGAGGGTPVVRGMMGNTVLYLVDGIRINNGRLFSGPNAFFNQIDVGSLDRIEILKGPGSVQYGSDAMGGVIQMQTQRPRPDVGHAYNLGDGERLSIKRQLEKIRSHDRREPPCSENPSYFTTPDRSTTRTN